MRNEFTPFTGSALNVKMFDAAGDGRTDDTAAIRKAVAALPAHGGAILFPSGHYRTDVIRTPSNATFFGQAAWGYRDAGAVVLSPLRDDQPCLFDANGVQGTRFIGLSLDGEQRGKSMDGINGHQGTDNWISDNQIGMNGRAGIYGAQYSSATITGNRIEQNGRGGIVIGPEWVEHVQITGCLFCANYGPGIDISGERSLEIGNRVASSCVTITGNMFRHSGRDGAKDSRLDCHLRLAALCNVSVTGNTFFTRVGPDPSFDTHPQRAIVLKGLQDAVVTGNALYDAAVDELIVDEGGHENLIVANNPGRLATYHKTH